MSDRSQKALKYVSRSEKKRHLGMPDGENWAPIRATMIESEAYRALTLAARMVFDRLVIEHINHAGRENGRLKVSYSDFESFGVDRHSIRSSLDELIRLGFVECMMPGRRAFGSDPGRTTAYRLTVFGVVSSDDAGKCSDDWKALSADEVKAIKAELRQKRAVKKGRATHRAEETVVPFRSLKAA